MAMSISRFSSANFLPGSLVVPEFGGDGTGSQFWRVTPSLENQQPTEIPAVIF